MIVKELDKASGVWSLNEQIEQKMQATWPNRSDATVDYLVVAGGGGGGVGQGGGGGAGGYRASGFGPSPLQGTAATLGFGDYTITVGAGGAGSGGQPSKGTSGSDSVFGNPAAPITSAGGGGGGTGSTMDFNQV